MIETLRKQAWDFICSAFPERQIYIRSDGRVQFFTFGPLLQSVIAGIVIVTLGWVAYTSVNVVFKDGIIATKDRRYTQMQVSYEKRIADLQLSYDQLNATFVAAEDRFKTAIDDLDQKHQMLADLVGRKRALQSSINISAAAPDVAGEISASAAGSPDLADTGTGGPSDAHDGEVAPASAADIGQPLILTPDARASAGKAPTRQRGAALGNPRKLATMNAGFFDGAVVAVEKFTGTMFKRRPASPNATHPAFVAMAAEEGRLAPLDAEQGDFVIAAEADVQKEIDRLNRAARIAGIDPARLAKRKTASGGTGGPFIPARTSMRPGDAEFYGKVAELQDTVDELDTLVGAVKTIPLSPPLDSGYGVTSTFGTRVDPFTKAAAFHSGMDFAGPYNSVVHATAPGVVVYASARGAYGNTVEIDHGYGVRTRYGHLRAIDVKVGQRVTKDEDIGKLGSTGRSTGPHVHYEVWYDNTVRNPFNFLKAGRYVLED